MLPIEEDADTGIVAGGSGGFDDLLERVRRKQFKKRVVSESMEGGADSYIFVTIHTLIYIRDNRLGFNAWN